MVSIFIVLHKQNLNHEAVKIDTTGYQVFPPDPFNRVAPSRTDFLRPDRAHPLRPRSLFIILVESPENIAYGHIPDMTRLYEIKLTFSRNTSLFVIFVAAVRESCTIPMTGRLDWGVRIIRGTMIIS